MSKRNLILLIIILAVISAVVLGFSYFYQPENETNGTSVEGTNFLANFLPFGKDKTTVPEETDAPVDVSGYVPPTTTEGQSQNLKLNKISSFPVAGFGIYMKERFKDVPVVTPPAEPVQEPEQKTTKTSVKPVAPPTEFVPALRYVNKATGNIYQTFADRIDERKFSSTIIPRVYEAYFGSKGESVIMRYLKEDTRTIETFIGVIPKEYLGADSAGMNEITGSFLPENISDMSVSPDTLKIFYLFNTGDITAGVTHTLQTSTKVQVFDSPFTEWLSSWPKNNLITVTTKPSANVPGFMYAINTDKKDFSKILGGINGLTTLPSPDGKMVIYADSNLSLSILNIITGDSALLGVKTLPEKCVWTGASDNIYCAVPKLVNQAQYPDAWYQGEISFSDEIWKIDVESGSTLKVLDPISVSGEDIDAVKPGLDENQDYLFFINKKDSYLWGLGLK